MKTGREHWRSRGDKPPLSNQEAVREYASSVVRRWAYGSVALGGVVAFVVGLAVEGLWGGWLWGDGGVGICGWGNVYGLFIFRVGGEDEE